MADYVHEMGGQPLGEEERPDQSTPLVQFLEVVRFMIEEVEQHKLPVPPPASKQVVEELPTVKVQHDGEECVVCLKDLAQCDNVKQLPCKHEFHAECILTWLAKRNSCPVCRHELPTDNVMYEKYSKQKLRVMRRKQEIEAMHNSMFS